MLAKGLWGFIGGSEELANDADVETQADFQKKSQRAFSTLVMAISTPQLYLVTSCEGAKDAWDALRNHYERETLANKLFLKKRYFRSEMKEGTSIKAHLKYMKEITDKLAAIGAPISEEYQVVTLLGSLPQSYSTLVTALEACVDGVTLSFVQQALIHEEQKLNEEPGHLSSAMSRGETTSVLVGERRRNVSQRVKCFGCGEAGHIRRYCPNKMGSQHKAKAAKEDHSKSESDDEEALAVTTFTTQKIQWLIDSGASSHMTQEKEVLTDYKEFEKPEKVGLGDGRTVDAIGIGKVYVNLLFKVSDPKKGVLYNVLYVPKLTYNLFSVKAAVAKGNSVKFGPKRCWIWNPKGKSCAMGSLSDNLY